MTDSLDELKAEVARLRAEVDALKAGGGADLVCRSVSLVDEDGGKRVALAATEEGGLLHVYGPDGELRAGIGIAESGGFIPVLSPDGQIQVAMGGDADGGILIVYGRGGETLASVKAEEEGGRISVAVRLKGDERAAFPAVDGD